MTGKRKTLTPMEKEARRLRWQNAAVKRRAARLRSDPEYREAHRKQAREHFRARHGVDPSTFRDCRSNLEELETFGEVREVEGEPHVTFTVPELAKVLGDYNPQIMRRWIAKGQLPEPALEIAALNTAKKRVQVEVYLEDEVRAMVEVLGEHQAETAYYRASHTQTITRLHEAVQTVRDELGV
jgi:hypothetical protein